ncbi:MAG: hypothetical protein P4L92_13075 [Rudaea sp.]|nr:hypothetical protein [Rudaea sp.]
MRKPTLILAVALCAALSSGCAVSGGGYGYGYEGGGVSVGLDYYEPYGGYYGGWGPGYRVGPVRGGDHRRDARGGSTQHAYRSAPASHSAPSIPSRPHSSGGSRH